MDEYTEYLKKQDGINSGIAKMFNNIQPFQLLLLFVMVFIANSMIKNNKDNKFTLVIVAVALGIFIFSLARGGKELKEIPRYIAQRIAKDDLQREIESNGSYANGTKVIPTSYFRDQTWDTGDGPKLFKYHIGFVIQKPDHGPDNIIYEMNPFNGRCKAIRKSDIQFEGQDVNDVKIIPVTEIINNKGQSSQE